MPAFIDMTGQRFGRLTAVTAIEQDRRNRIWRWLCRCDCGETTIVYGTNLRRGTSRSCGCWQREAASIRNTVHGANKPGKRTVEYETWQRMLDRCYNPRCKDFKNYGGRGIEVCERWHDFVNFLADMGLRPAGKYSIERVNNDGNYEPSNCIWLLQSEQPKNQRRNRNLT